MPSMRERDARAFKEWQEEIRRTEAAKAEKDAELSYLGQVRSKYIGVPHGDIIKKAIDAYLEAKYGDGKLLWAWDSAGNRKQP